VKEIRLLELPNAGVCCGFGGPFSVKFDQLSTSMAAEKVNSVLETGATHIISTEFSCLMHLDSYIRKHRLPLKTIHLAEVLANGWNE
jgi:L-lactate dehydrogenase complex protein LldE